MVKTLKFRPKLIPLILTGKKTGTWRLWDDKDIKTGDVVSFLNWVNLNTFAKAKIVSVVEKPMDKLTSEDKKIHEVFASNKEMYTTYSRYYGKPVGPKTMVKIIKFRLI